MSTLQETSLARVWQHAESDRPIAMITAFRNEYPKEENLQRNKDLAARIRKLGLGYFFVDGYWIENQGTPEEVHVAEDSIFVIGVAGNDEEFVTAMVELGARFGQDGVLIKTEAGANIYDKAGNIDFNVGTLRPGKAGEIYTRLRGNTDRATFVFEAERDDLGWLQRLAGIQANK
jgi:hypothetical protein